MKFKLLLVMIVSALLTQSKLQAAPIQYEGNLTSGQTVTGSVGGFGWTDDDAANVDFWSFTSIAGTRISIAGTRLDTPLDLAFSLFQGTTTADASLFTHDANFGGLLLRAIADDEVEVPGPFGDPRLSSFLVPFTSAYTVAIGGNLSDAAGPFRYSLNLSFLQQVPEPASPLLLAAALMLLPVGLAHRRRKPSR
jgi:hypothetical protein